MEVYSLLDRKLKEFGQLVVAKNDELVRRSLLDGIRGSKSVMELHSSDFDLFCVGSFDEETGILTHKPLRLVVNVGDILEAYAAGQKQVG